MNRRGRLRRERRSESDGGKQYCREAEARWGGGDKRWMDGKHSGENEQNDIKPSLLWKVMCSNETKRSAYVM